MIENNVEKWAVDNKKCMKFWVANRDRFNDCSRCFTTCVWNLPDTRWARVITWGIPKWRWWRMGFFRMDNLIRGEKPNPQQEWRYYKFPGAQEGDGPYRTSLNKSQLAARLRKPFPTSPDYA